MFACLSLSEGEVGGGVTSSMNFKNKILITLFAVVVLFGFAPTAHMAVVNCFCFDDPAKIDEKNYPTAEQDFQSTGALYCGKEMGGNFVCNPGKVARGGAKSHYDSCNPSLLNANLLAVLMSAQDCNDAFKIWQGNKTAKLSAGKVLEQSTQPGVGLGIFLPACVNSVAGCRDAGVFVEMGINIASYLFSIIGALALLMFVYGGITLVMSMGNPEKVKKGGEIMMAAVLGLIIVFGSYVLIQFLGDALVSSEYVLK